jgi:hypothetical protein
VTGRPINALELYSRFRNEMQKPDPFRANEVPVDRGFLAPLATYADGQTELAIPAFPLGAIWDGVRSFGALGFDTPEAIKHNAGASLDAAGGAIMAGAGVGLAGGAMPKNAVGIFGGRLAKTADQNALARAEKLAAEGAPREQIWNDTGWFQGVDGQWKFEINDQASFVRPDVATDAFSRAVGDQVPVRNADRFLEHPLLFDAYPDMWRVNTRWTIDDDLPSGSYFQRESGTEGVNIEAKNAAQARSIALHEYQHAIQDREGFAQGSNAFEDGLKDYRRSAGEQEAKAVQRRQDLLPEARQSRPPWLDYDVPEADQIVRFGNSVAANAKSGAAVPLLQNALERSNVRPPSGPWPETAGFDERLGAVRQTFENPNDLYRLPLPFSKAAPEDRLPYNHSDLIDGKEAITKEVQIRDLLSFQDNAVRDDVRALTNPEIRAGAGEPTVVRYRGNDQIVDGHHRLLADLLNGADAATVRYIDSLYANAPTGAAVPLAGEAQDTDPALIEYLRAVGLM